jgi:hypothetical protein
MKQMSIRLDKFDLIGFFWKIHDFLEGRVRNNFDAGAIISRIESVENWPNDEDAEDWSFGSELINDELFVFFPFAIPNSEAVYECADDSRCKIWPCVRQDEMGIRGYLVRVTHGTVTIASADFYYLLEILPPMIDLVEDGVMKKRMTAFVQKFVK